MDQSAADRAMEATNSPVKARRLAVLAHVLAEGSLLNGALDRLAAAVSAALAVPVVHVSLVDSETQHFLGQTGLAPGAARGIPISHSFCRLVVAQAAPMVIDSAADDPRVAGDPAIADLGVAAYAGHPIVIAGHVLGTLAAVDHAPRAWQDREVTALGAFAELAEYLIASQATLEGEMLDQQISAQARDDRQTAELSDYAERVSDYAEQVSEQDRVEALSRRLQNALLPQGTPPGDIVVDAFYQPGSERLLLGGDFADTTRDAANNLNFVIGDVTGHGPEAAALAISLRASWNALQSVGLPLAEITAELDKQTNVSGLLATVLLGRIETDGRLCLLGAGHPAPLLVDPGAGARELDIGRGPMLGLSLPAPRWPVTEHTLGDAELIAYTDGLIEGHVTEAGDGGVRFEVGRLIEAVASHGTDPAALCAVATAANGRPLPDDVAILRLRARR